MMVGGFSFIAANATVMAASGSGSSAGQLFIGEVMITEIQQVKSHQEAFFTAIN